MKPFMLQKEMIILPYKKSKNMANNNSPKGKHIIQAKISKNVPDLSDHSFFVEKRDAVTTFLKHHPLPAHLLSKK